MVTNQGTHTNAVVHSWLIPLINSSSKIKLIVSHKRPLVAATCSVVHQSRSRNVLNNASTCHIYWSYKQTSLMLLHFDPTKILILALRKPWKSHKNVCFLFCFFGIFKVNIFVISCTLANTSVYPCCTQTLIY